MSNLIFELNEKMMNMFILLVQRIDEDLYKYLKVIWFIVIFSLISLSSIFLWGYFYPSWLHLVISLSLLSSAVITILTGFQFQKTWHEKKQILNDLEIEAEKNSRAAAKKGKTTPQEDTTSTPS